MEKIPKAACSSGRVGSMFAFTCSRMITFFACTTKPCSDTDINVIFDFYNTCLWKNQGFHTGCFLNTIQHYCLTFVGTDAMTVNTKMVPHMPHADDREEQWPLVSRVLGLFLPNGTVNIAKGHSIKKRKCDRGGRARWANRTVQSSSPTAGTPN